MAARRPAAVIEAEHLRDAIVAGSLTAAQVAELAAGAADWLQPEWPKEPEAVDDVKRLAAVTRELPELRERALGLAADAASVGRVVTVDAVLREVLRSQSLLGVEFNHEPLEDIRDLAPAELLRTASIFRDAIAVLDAIGWLPTSRSRHGGGVDGGTSGPARPAAC